MIQPYNYMLQSLPVKKNVRYHVNKKSELKNVYNKIVNISKYSPFYRVNLSRENQEYAIGIKEAALSLEAKINDMTDPEISGFKSRMLSVSDTDILTAQLLDEPDNEIPESITFQIHSLACNQINRGKELLDSSRGLPAGDYEFLARLGEETHSLIYHHPSRMENKVTLKNFADFLNQSLTGICAAVEKGSGKNYSRLVIASEQSGRFGERQLCFEDEDTNDKGIADYFGMNRVETAPACAQFQLNGMDKRTATNAFTLENVIRVNLKSCSEKQVTVKLVHDSARILNAVGDVLTGFNDVISLAKNRTLESEEHYKASKLLGEMKKLEEIYHEELCSCGLIVDENQELYLEDALAVQAAQDGGMESLFTRENGFITRLLDKIEAIAINPMEYLDNTIVTYPNNAKNTYRNPYVTSMYSGLFFNSYC